MSSPYWTVMNSLSNSITSYCTVSDLIRNHHQDPEVMLTAASLLDTYIQQQDKLMAIAWKKVINTDDSMPPWGHSDMEALKYSEETLEAMCDQAERDELNLLQSKGQIYKNYRAVIDEYNRLNDNYELLEYQYNQLQDLFYESDVEYDELKLKHAELRKKYLATAAVITNMSEELFELQKQLDSNKEYDC